jgi:predicted DNA-binding transcriptional regulator AlpA
VILAGITMYDLAEQLGINESTLYRKINANGDFSRAEIDELIRILEIEKPMDIFFATELA